MKLNEIARYRLRSQQIAQPRFHSAADLVAWLGAVQAQDYSESLWAIGLRTRGLREADVEQAVADRAIIRTWPMRGTLHFVSPNDVHWMLQLLTPRVVTAAASRYRQLELDAATFAKAEKVVVHALRGHQPVERPALHKMLLNAGIATADNRGLHIIGYLAQQRVICFGPRSGKQPTFVLLDEWVPNTTQFDRGEALGKLAARYFRSHGPATLKDLTWWAGITVKDARAAIEAAGPQLVAESLGGQTFWFDPETRPARSDPERVHLLPMWDEYTVAYRDRSAVLASTKAKQVNAGGGILRPTVVIDGQVVGTWGKKRDGDAISVRLTPFARLSKLQIAGVRRALQRLGEFRGTEIDLS